LTRPQARSITTVPFAWVSFDRFHFVWVRSQIAHKFPAPTSVPNEAPKKARFGGVFLCRKIGAFESVYVGLHSFECDWIWNFGESREDRPRWARRRRHLGRTSSAPRAAIQILPGVPDLRIPYSRC
jgi:hypothetical protein